MNKILERKKFWITGSAISLGGVIAVRVIAPGLSGVIGIVVMVSGYALSLAGIGIIACCTKDRAIIMKNERLEKAEEIRRDDA